MFPTNIRTIENRISYHNILFASQRIEYRLDYATNNVSHSHYNNIPAQDKYVLYKNS